MIKSYKNLEVYIESYDLAMEVFHLTKKFPKEEVYSLTSQIVRASRSVSANISEGWSKRNYESIFKQHLIHALGSNSEVETWLKFAFDCGYIDEPTFQKLTEQNTINRKKIDKTSSKLEKP